MPKQETVDATHPSGHAKTPATTTLTRRTLLVATGFGALTALAGQPVIANAQPTLDDSSDGDRSLAARVTVVDQYGVDVFCDDWATLATVAFPTHLAFSGLSAASVLSINWDPRVFVPPTRAYLTTDDTDQMQPAVLTVDAEAGAARIEVPAGTRGLTVPVGVKPEFPNELVAAPSATSYALAAGEDGTNATILPVLTPVSSWGAELLTLWSESSGAVYPAGVRMQSVGPQPTPSSLVILVGVDERLDSSLNTDEAVDASTMNKRTEYRFEVGAVPAGEFHDIVFPESDSTPEHKGQLRSPAVPYIRIAVDDSDARGMRDTGRTSVVPLAPSGSPLSSYEKYESA